MHKSPKAVTKSGEQLHLWGNHQQLHDDRKIGKNDAKKSFKKGD